jgi:hypothetical protein
MANRKRTKEQNTTEKTKDLATRTPLKTGVNSGATRTPLKTGVNSGATRTPLKTGVNSGAPFCFALRILITRLVSCGHGVVCQSSIYIF